jgi:KaiC/GvpD/RAD55 family RecA-like ATPase
MTRTEQVSIYRKLFKVRPDVYGVSYLLPDSEKWTGTSVKSALGIEQLNAHLGGTKITNVANRINISECPQMLGGYVADYKDNCFVGIVDIDQSIIEMVEDYVHEAEKLFIPVYVEKSKVKGYHIWHFFENATPAYKVRQLLMMIAQNARFPETEIFPKQDFASASGEGLGNYMNLPLQGKLAKEGRTVFLDQDNIWNPYESQWDFLKTIKYIPESFITAIPDKQPVVNGNVKKQNGGDKDKTPCTELLQSGSEEGGRHYHMIQIAGTLGRLVPKDIFTAITRNWNLLYNKPPMTEERFLLEVENNWKSFGKFEKDDSGLIELGTLIRSHPDLSEAYVKSVLALKDTRILTCIPDMDIPMRGLCGGEILTILGRPHSGKTALAQSIMYHVWDKQGLPSLMFSLEMSAEQLYERGASMLLGIDGADIEKSVLNGEFEKDIKRRAGGFEGVRYLDMAGLSVNQMERCIMEAEMKPKLVVIDYLSIIGGKGKDEREQVARVFKDIQTMAKTVDVAIILLSQVSRAAGDEFSEISIKDGYGSSAIEQDSYFIWALWKDMEDTKHRHLKLLKNKRGDAGQECLMRFLNPSPRLFPIEKKVDGAKYGTTGLEGKEYEY